MKRIDKVDLLAGLLITVIGAYFLLGSLEFRMGTVQRMGPGYIPFALGAVCIALGLIITALSFGPGGDWPRPSLRAVICVLGSILVFALLLNRLGLMPATVAAVVSAMAADREANLKASLIAAAIIAVLAWLVFVAILGLQMRAFRLPI
jgi:hypothetical protein